VILVSSSVISRGDDIGTVFENITPDTSSVSPPTFNGVICKDSSGAIYVAATNGKLYITKDVGATWQPFASPSTNGTMVTHMAAGPTGYLFAVDSSLNSGETHSFLFDPQNHVWRLIDGMLQRPNFTGPPVVTGIWYINQYVYEGTANMGLYRSIRPIIQSGVKTPDHYAPFQVFPNPASTRINVTFPSTLKGQMLFIDMTGRILKKISLDNAREISLDVSDIPNGIYELKCDRGKWAATKISIQH